MNHRLVWVGRKARCPFLTAANDYQKRLARLAGIDVVMIRPGDAQTEARAMARAAATADVVIALDERGTQRTTMQYADYFSPHRSGQQTFCYLIGGADGFCDTALRLARERWSLSTMTLPHRAVVALWLEQLYRVHSLLAGSAYHRGDRE